MLMNKRNALQVLLTGAGLTAFMRDLGYREVMVSNFEDAFRPNPDQTLPNILTGIYRRR